MAGMCAYPIRPRRAGTAWIVYEYILTFTQEVELLWRRKFTGATLLFLVNRYLLLAYFGQHFIDQIPALQTVSMTTVPSSAMVLDPLTITTRRMYTVK